jgi:hypothetical protein
MPYIRFLWSAVVLSPLWAAPLMAGTNNPDISVLGQPRAVWTNDRANPDRLRTRLDIGETEFVFDAYLNPYAKGFFVVSLGEEGAGLEEGFFTVFRSLPLNLGLKAGKYRVGFGKLNPAHPHTYPVADRFGVLAAYLPGDEAFNEVGVSLSRRFAVGEQGAVELTVDGLQGDTFRIEREPTGDPGDPLASGSGDGSNQTRPAFNGRVSYFDLLGERSGLEFGATIAQGTNNVAARARTTIFGFDAKAKLWRSPQASLLLQAEGLELKRDEAAWSPVSGYTLTGRSAAGFYLLADYAFAVHYSLGASYERFQTPAEEKPWNSSVGAHAAYAVLEESLVVHGGWDHPMPEAGDAADTITLWIVYSMGPHKAHQF